MHFTFLPWVLTPEPKFTKIGDDLPPTQAYHLVKFHRRASTHAGISVTNFFADKERKTIYPRHVYRHVGITIVYGLTMDGLYHARTHHKHQTRDLEFNAVHANVIPSVPS